MRRPTMLSNSRKVSCLKSRTGWSHKTTNEFLKENNWNLEQAINAYDLMIEASLVPSKNSNALLERNKCTTNTDDPHIATPSLDKKKINKSKKTGEQKEGDAVARGSRSHLDEFSEAVFMLPDLSKFVRMSDAFKKVLISEFINVSTQELLVKRGQLNWWTSLGLQPLYPLVTMGDGNCLLHAASIALNGISDENLALRSELHHLINCPQHTQAFYRRWRLQQTINNKQTGLVFSEQEWLNEWRGITTMASPDPINADKACDTASCTTSSQDNISYSSLEEIHVFVLAHLLARPIIVVADDFYRNSKGEAIAPIPFSGIYLPLQLPPTSCHKAPIHIAYNAAHFMAVCPIDSLPASPVSSEVSLCYAYVPLVDSKFNLMPLHFSRDPGDRFEEHSRPTINERKSLEEKFSLLERYFEVDMISLSGGEGGGEVGSSSLSINHHTITNDLHAPDLKTTKAHKRLDKLKRFAESTGANFKKTFHKSLFSKGQPLGARGEHSPPQHHSQLNNSFAYSIDSLLSRCKIPTARSIYLRQEFYAENIEEYINMSKVRLAEGADTDAPVSASDNSNNCNNNNTFSSSRNNSSNNTPNNYNILHSPHLNNANNNLNNSKTPPLDDLNQPTNNSNNELTPLANNSNNNNTNCTEQQRPAPLSNQITNSFKTHKIHDKNVCKLNKLKDVNYFNKSFDEAKSRMRIKKELDERTRRVLFGQGVLIRSSMSDTFKSYQALSGVRLEKFTKGDNNGMVTATETNACDFNDHSPCDRKVPQKADLT